MSPKPDLFLLKPLVAKTASGVQTLILGAVWSLAMTGKLARSVERWANGDDGSGEPAAWDMIDRLVSDDAGFEASSLEPRAATAPRQP